jgi:hypothetical protein
MEQITKRKINFTFSILIFLLSVITLILSIKGLLNKYPEIILNTIIIRNIPLIIFGTITLFMIFPHFNTIKKEISESKFFEYQFRINLGIISGIILSFAIILFDSSYEKYSILFVGVFILPVLIIAYIISIFFFFFGYFPQNKTENNSLKNINNGNGITCFFSGLLSLFLPVVFSMFLFQIILIPLTIVFFIKQVKERFSFFALFGFIFILISALRIVLLILSI